MKIQGRGMVWLVPAFFFLTFPVWQSLAGRVLAPPEVSFGRSADNEGGRFRMSAITMTHSEEGQTLAVVSAAGAGGGDWDHNDISLHQVEAHIFRDGKLTTHVLSEEGLYQADQQIFAMTGNVSLLLGERQELRGEEFLYLLAEKMISSETDITFTSGEGLKVEGGGMSYDLESGSWQVDGRVRCGLNL